ncbi:acid protease, partial [Gyrodon lividus]
EPVFAFSLAAPGPELYLGGTNPDRYTGDFTWAPVIPQGHWRVNIDSVVGNGQKVLIDILGVIDTGSAIIVGPPKQVAALYMTIGATPLYNIPGFYSFPCDAVPKVSFTFGGRSFPIAVKTFSVGSYSGDPSRCVGAIVAGNVVRESPICSRAVMTCVDGSEHQGTWIIGTPFLSGVYTAFDLANLRVGFATLPAA